MITTQDSPLMFEDESEGFKIEFHKGGVIFTHDVGLGEVDYHAHAGQVDEIYEAFKAVVPRWWTSAFDLPPIGEYVLVRRLVPSWLDGSGNPKEVFMVAHRRGPELSWRWAQRGAVISYPAEEITHWQPLPKREFS